ncbi:MAG TPA: hypothetical protein VFB99_13495, partial [Vicinamibacterales bacterium]|nr:hypothetical protein [Vicinamibacterales bacterium]
MTSIELVRVGHGKTFEQQQIQQTKDRRTGADADGEREDRGGGEARRAPHRSNCVAQIGAQIVDDCKTARLATGLLPPDHIADSWRACRSASARDSPCDSRS